MLSEKGRQELANLLNVMEGTGQLPYQLEIFLMVLLAKPQGGYRPIAILPALHRLWMKIRRPHSEAWEQKWHRSFFAMAEGQEPGDTAWRSDVKKEAAIGNGEQAATLLWDMKEAYEVIDYQHLIAEAAALHFPLVLLRLNLSTYSSGRRGSFACVAWCRQPASQGEAFVQGAGRLPP